MKKTSRNYNLPLEKNSNPSLHYPWMRLLGETPHICVYEMNLAPTFLFACNINKVSSDLTCITCEETATQQIFINKFIQPTNYTYNFLYKYLNKYIIYLPHQTKLYLIYQFYASIDYCAQPCTHNIATI